MKIIVGRIPSETQILTDEGVDITKDLCCTEISVHVSMEGVTATITCEHVDLVADIDYDNLVAQVRVRTIRE